MAMLCQVLSTERDNLWAFELPDGRGIRKAAAYHFPFLSDKSKWPLKPDVRAWTGWPARQPHLLFAGRALREPAYLDRWKKLPANPSNPRSSATSASHSRCCGLGGTPSRHPRCAWNHSTPNLGGSGRFQTPVIKP